MRLFQLPSVVCRTFALVVAALGAAGCPASSSEPPTEGPPLCTGQPDDEALDLRTHCAGDDVDVALIGSNTEQTLTTEALPTGFAVEEREDGWRLRGTVPATADIADASFVLVEDRVVDGCIVRQRYDVALFFDACTERETCADGVDSFPIAGACLPDAIAADTAFAVTTSIEACLGSSCHEVRPALCDVVVDGTTITVGGSACVRDADTGSCSEDCGGGDGAPCAVPALSAGTYTLQASGGSLTFTIPFDGGDVERCTSDQ